MKSVVKFHIHCDAILQAAVERFNIVDLNVEIDFPPISVARPPPFIEHNLPVPEGHRRPTHLTIILMSSIYSEAYRLVPLHSGANVGDVDHWGNALCHKPLR